MREIIELFIERLAARLPEMQAAFQRRDFHSLAKAAHWLKGLGGTAGFWCFTKMAAELETLAKNAGPVDAIKGLFAQLLDAQSRIELPADLPANGHPTR